MTPAELKAWREGMGLSQAKAAVLLGVHLRTVTAWEIGQHPIPHMAALACRWLANTAVRERLELVDTIFSLDALMPNGKPLCECHGRECWKWGAKFLRLARLLGPSQLVGDLFATDIELREAV